MFRAMLCAVVLFACTATNTHGKECTYITMGYNSFAQIVTIVSQSNIKNVKILRTSKGVSVEPTVTKGQVSQFAIKVTDQKSWRVDFEVTDQCRTWRTYMATSNLEP